MSARQAITRNKTKLQAILTADYSLILNKVHENKMVTDREYNKLKEIPRLDMEGHVIGLVDKLMNKGEDTCKAFLHLLQKDCEINDTFPNLITIAWQPSSPVQSCPDAPSCVSNETSNSTPCTGVPVQETQRGVKEDDHYKISSSPCGLCLIINNESFNNENGPPLKKRCGTNKDAEDLARVFNRLRFKVVMCKDQTKHNIEDILKLFSSLTDLEELRKCGAEEWSGSHFTELNMRPQHGDAFICCILSHGEKGSIHGTCGESIPVEKITSTFNGRNCRALLGKPKVFFIQACQGLLRQHSVVADGGSVEADAYPDQMVFTPEEADFLVAIATVQNYVSFRHRDEGSWFIQSLCTQLEVSCPRGDDIVTILTHVNDKVSQRVVSAYPDLNKKFMQMPEVRFTLRKKLVFPFSDTCSNR